jgi:hypothetical protein
MRMSALTAPVVIALCAGPGAAQDQPRFTVSGVVINEGASVAWIGEPSYTKNRLQRVRVGDSVGPYRVVAIREDRVELAGPSGPLVLRLTASAPDMPPATGAVATAPSPPSAGTPGSRTPSSGTRSAAGGSRSVGTPRAPGEATAPVAGTQAQPRPQLTPDQEVQARAEVRAYIDRIKGPPKVSGWGRLMGRQ